jgi:hypothetical protein
VVHGHDAAMRSVPSSSPCCWFFGSCELQVPFRRRLSHQGQCSRILLRNKISGRRSGRKPQPLVSTVITAHNAGSPTLRTAPACIRLDSDSGLPLPSYTPPHRLPCRCTFADFPRILAHLASPSDCRISLASQPERRSGTSLPAHVGRPGVIPWLSKAHLNTP